MEDSHSFLYGTMAVFSLLTLATIIHALCKKTKIPFAVGLLFSGVFLTAIFNKYSWGGAEYLQFSPEIVFYVFLPTLIFESAYHLNFRYFQGVLKEVCTLSIFGFLCSTAIVASGLHYFIDLPWIAAILFGSLISATDPVAVLSIFKEMKAPKKLSTIVDGESLLNDGIALVVFQFFFKIAILGASIALTPNLLFTQGILLSKAIVLGIIVGIVFGIIFSFAISQARSKGVQLTLSLILAHATFLIAEGILGVSGILATMTAGLIMGNYGKRKLSLQTKKSFAEIWSFLGFVSNSLIFILLGLKLGEVNFAAHLNSILFATILTIVIARSVSVFASFFITNQFKKGKQKISYPFQVVTIWGGLRGALAAAAVLLIPESYAYAEQLQAMTAGVILASFLLNAMTIPKLLKWLKIIEFTFSETIQKIEAQILTNEKICQYLDSLLKRQYISAPIHETLKSKYEKHKDYAIKQLEKVKKILPKSDRENEKILTHYALGIELKTYKTLFEKQELSEDRFITLRNSIHRQEERLENDILPDERKFTAKFAPVIPIACPLCKNIKIKWLKKLITKAFKYRQTQQIKLRLQHYRARRIASWKVAYDFEKLEESHSIFKDSETVKKIIKRYKDWNQNSKAKMSTLEKKFPIIVIKERLQIAEGSCFKKEQEIEKEFFEKGLICEKVFEDLDAEIEKKAQKTFGAKSANLLEA